MNRWLSRVFFQLLTVALLGGGAARADLLYVSDSGTNTVNTVGPGGSSAGGTVFASGFSSPTGLVLDNGGNLFVANTSNGR